MMLMITRKTYVVQVYEVGAKYRKSLAIIIPAKVAKENRINKNTTFVLWVNQNQEIMLQNIDPMIEANARPFGESLQAE